jgi:predicted O-methyltransferase YrrM
MLPELPPELLQIKGFLAPGEAEALYDCALQTAALGPLLEVGSYCGKSTIYLGLAARSLGATVYALDHHRGSEEHQPGEFFHDPDLYDASTDGVDTFREFRRNIRRAGLEDTVVPIVAGSAVTARSWRTPLGMVFIDGGHSLDAALTDYRSWASHILPGGLLAIHDIYPDPFTGGQAPYAVLQLARNSGLFEEVSRVESLAVLRRL